MRSAELLVENHSTLRRGLDVLDGMVKKMEDGERIEIADALSILTFLRLFGHDYHRTTEEKTLFPMLLRSPHRASSPAEALQQLLLQHAVERDLLASVENALKNKRGMEF